jgi:hypothetical protein
VEAARTTLLKELIWLPERVSFGRFQYVFRVLDRAAGIPRGPKPPITEEVKLRALIEAIIRTVPAWATQLFACKSIEQVASYVLENERQRTVPHGPRETWMWEQHAKQMQLLDHTEAQIQLPPTMATSPTTVMPQGCDSQLLSAAAAQVFVRRCPGCGHVHTGNCTSVNSSLTTTASPNTVLAVRQQSAAQCPTTTTAEPVLPNGLTPSRERSVCRKFRQGLCSNTTC